MSKVRLMVMYELVNYLLPEIHRHVLHFMISYFFRVSARDPSSKPYLIQTFGGLFLPGDSTTSSALVRWKVVTFAYFLRTFREMQCWTL